MNKQPNLFEVNMAIIDDVLLFMESIEPNNEVILNMKALLEVKHFMKRAEKVMFDTGVGVRNINKELTKAVFESQG